MKRFLTIVLFCSFGFSVFGQEIERNASDSLFVEFDGSNYQAPRKSKKNAKWRKNSIAISCLINSDMMDDNDAPFNRYIYVGSGTPYTVYSESQYVASRPMTVAGFGLQYYHAWAKNCYLGLIGSTSISSQTLYKRTTGNVANRYENKNIYLAPVVKYTLTDDDIPDFHIYGSLGVATLLNIHTSDNTVSTTLAVKPLMNVGFVIGERLYFFEEVGTTFSSVVINFGWGFNF